MGKTQQSETENGDTASTFSLATSLAHLLHRGGQVASDLHFATFGNEGLTQRQLALLVAVADAKAASQSQLVSATGIDRSTLAEMVVRMTKKGLLVRTKSTTDNRVKTVSLTEAGQGALAFAVPQLEAIDVALKKQLPAKSRSALITMLGSLIAPNAADTPKKATKAKKKAKKKKSKKRGKAEPNQGGGRHGDSE
jgi:MarR family transcriptional regulator, temperature-dependent positive regulator of motility